MVLLVVIVLPAAVYYCHVNISSVYHSGSEKTQKKVLFAVDTLRFPIICLQLYCMHHLSHILPLEY
jgi:hypothetical protein